MDYHEYRIKIQATRARGGQYWTNIVSSLLRQAAEELGGDEANRLIRECKLSKDGWQERV